MQNEKKCCLGNARRDVALSRGRKRKRRNGLSPIFDPHTSPHFAIGNDSESLHETHTEKPEHLGPSMYVRKGQQVGPSPSLGDIEQCERQQSEGVAAKKNNGQHNGHHRPRQQKKAALEESKAVEGCRALTHSRGAVKVHHLTPISLVIGQPCVGGGLLTDRPDRRNQPRPATRRTCIEGAHHDGWTIGTLSN